MDRSTELGKLSDLARVLRRASHDLDAAIVTCLGDQGVGRWHVLDAIVGESGLAMSQLAEATVLNGASLTRLIDALIADNLVFRKVDDLDRRRVLVFPTRRGVAEHERMSAALVDGGLAGLAEASSDITDAVRALTTKPARRGMSTTTIRG
ncbi:MarR family winged helix-turn-helix transcriptional regulator [Tsukamurella soli]|uniref:MarR family transcriptional regulator n=1 Tax=Tsukamurella soli TaxID=644556 RepID=A0ABP8JY60_9ACTN